MLPTVFFSSELFIDGCQCWRPDVPNCGQDEIVAKMDHFQEDLDDIANSIMKVMGICRLKAWEVKRTKDLIKRSFRHYDQIRCRIDRVPIKRFNKENFMHDLAVEAGMNRMDSQLAYGITKRAFRAYYHGTGEDGVQLSKLAKQMKHRSECLWLHAAKRTSEVFAVYAGLMYSEQKQYEECIECVYKALYEELASRVQYEDDNALPTCTCKPNVKSQQSGLTEKPSKAPWDAPSGMSTSNFSEMTTEILYKKKVVDISKPTSPISIRTEYLMVSVTNSQRSVTDRSGKNASPSKKKPKKRQIVKCNCPNMQCFRERLKPVITAESSQGPYICRWVAHNEEEEQFKEHRVPCPPMEVICPPCIHEEESCDDECTCTCRFCRCSSAYGDVEEEHGEKLSKTGLEDHDTDYCWLAPFRDTPRVYTEPSEPSMEEEEEEEEVDINPCVCHCEYKRRAQPHLYTYVAPFTTTKEEPVEIEETVEEPVKPKVPPYGISWETYRCWNEPRAPNDERPEQVCEQCAYIALLSAGHNPPPKDLNVDITIKSQHYPSVKNQQSAKRPSKSSVIIKRNTIPATQNQKPIPIKEAKSKDLASKTAPQTIPAASAPAKSPAPAPASAPVPAPAPAAAKTNAPDDDKLTKEDVLEMFGLNK